MDEQKRALEKFFERVECIGDYKYKRNLCYPIYQCHPINRILQKISAQIKMLINAERIYPFPFVYDSLSASQRRRNLLFVYYARIKFDEYESKYLLGEENN